MKKLKTLFKAPVLTQSGYGHHSRQLLNALLKDPTFDISVENINWGITPFLTDRTEEHGKILQLHKKFLLEQQQGNQKYDLFIHVTIPNEFERKGAINIGVTAGIETDRVSAQWVQKCNEMDLVVVPSNHSREVITKTVIGWKNEQTGQIGELSVQKPVVVCHEGVDTSVFKNYRTTGCPPDVSDSQLNLEPDFCFLHVGQWGKGGFGEDRKNIANLVRYFIETFYGRKDVGLVLKINMARNSITDHATVTARLQEIKNNFDPEKVPPIYLLHGNLTKEEMAALYNTPKIKAFISLTHGEGFCGLDYTKIITESGLKRLDEIKIGEKVLTHNKRFMPVTQELSRNYNGDMYEIETFGGANKEKITLTGNHRVYVFKEGGFFEWVPAENIETSDILCIPKPKYRQFEQIKSIDLLKFINDNNVCELSENLLGYRQSNKCYIPCKRYFNVDEDFSKILGYYLAEGSYANSTIHFSLHKSEKTTIAKELIVAFKNVFGLEKHNIMINDNKLDLTFNSKIVGLFLKSFCGDDAKTKFIHKDVYKFSRLAKMNLITSLLLGDGYIQENSKNSSIEISLVNDQILRSVRILLLEEGILSNFDFFRRKGIIQERWNYDSEIERLRISQNCSFNYVVNWVNRNHDFANYPLHESKHTTKGRPKSWTTKDYCLFQIKEINKIPYNGKVYNLSVAEDESYCTENFMVHNCLPLLEAAACGLPILATNWSGHLDFLNKGKFSAIEYNLKEIPEVAVWEPLLVKGSRWAEVSADATKKRMNKITTSYSLPKEWAENLSKVVHEEFNLDITGKSFVDVVRQGILLSSEPMAAKNRNNNPVEDLKSLVDSQDDYNILYTMPRSTGDVFVSTAVIDGLMKEVPEGAKLYFATDSKYAGLLKGNPHVHKVIPYNQYMMNTELSEQVFDLVLTPDVATQYQFSNWTRGGQGRLLVEEYANHCQCEVGEYFIEKEEVKDLPENYMTVHTTSGKGQWEGREYKDWKETLVNLKKLYPVKVVQVGGEDEPALEEADLDLRGKTNYNELAYVLEKSELHLSPDTFTMHLAAGLNTPIVSLFGCSYANSTGPWVKDKENAKFLLLESERRSCGCVRACYKNKPIKNVSAPPINEIDPATVTEACAAILDNGKKFKGKFTRNKEHKYERIFGKISGYTTTYNLKGYPFVESITSMLGFCDEVVVVDGCSDDGTYEILEKLAEDNPKIQLYQNPWDFDEPGMDGLQKAFARALCEHEFLWQQDCDEVVHEDDYMKIKMITKRFPSQEDILHLPIIELWGNEQTVTGRRHSWKWRMSKNKPEITHGINKNARLTNEKTGKVYAKQGISDGCEYVNVMTYDMLSHVGFYSSQLEMLRLNDPDKFGEIMNKVFEELPTIYHYSWCSLEKKIRNFTDKWDKQWNVLYQTDNKERFPGVTSDEDIKKLAKHLYDQGGEDGDETKFKFKLNRTNPKVMSDWLASSPLIKDE